MSRRPAPRCAPGLALAVALAALTAALGLTGCPKPGDRGTDRPPRENRLQPGHAPTPFTADQIRKACPDGHFRKYRVEVEGKPAFFRILRFEKGTPRSTGFVSQQLDAKGRPFGEQRRTRALWKVLQAHASFPEPATRIRTVSLTTPAGTFQCWLYEVRTTQGGQPHLQRYWFAKSLPGPPVQFDHLVAGKRVFRMVLVSRGRLRPTP